MKYKINGYSCKKVIKSYIDNGSKIKVNYLDNSFKYYDSSKKDDINKEMHKQASKYASKPIFIERILLLLLVFAFYIFMLEFIVTTGNFIVTEYMEFSIDKCSILIKPFIKFVISYFGVKVIKKSIEKVSEEADDIKKYRCYLGMEKAFKTNDQDAYQKLVKNINNIDDISINELANFKDETEKKLVLKYNVNKFNKNLK